jgi:hypothetical protein
LISLFWITYISNIYIKYIAFVLAFISWLFFSTFPFVLIVDVLILWPTLYNKYKKNKEKFDPNKKIYKKSPKNKVDKNNFIVKYY